MINAFKIKRVRKAFLFTLAMMLVYCIGRNLVIPGINTDNFSSEFSMLSILSLLTGGSLETFSLFSLGVGPLITASIITELLSNDIIPYLKELKEQGQKGRKKLSRINQRIGFVLALLQSYSLVKLFNVKYGIIDNNVTSYIFVMVVMTAGCLLLGWIGSQITSYGIGNGLSTIILFGILVNLPNQLMTSYNSITQLAKTTTLGYVYFGIYVLILLLIMLAITWLSTGVRKIKIAYSGQKLNTGSQFTYLPIKPNTTSVLPLILANSVMTAPLIIVSYFSYSLYQKLESTIGLGTPIGTMILAVLLVLLGLFYGSLVLNPEDMDKNLSKNGGYIPGVRPGVETRKYLSSVINNTLLVGIIGLLFLVITPYILTLVFNIPSNITFGGTSFILIVAIITEIINTIETNVIESKYKEWGI